VFQCVAAVCCSVLQRVAVCCSVMQFCRSFLQFVAVCCSLLQCGAVGGSVLQCVAVRCIGLQGHTSSMTRVQLSREVRFRLKRSISETKHAFVTCIACTYSESCHVWMSHVTHMNESPDNTQHLRDKVHHVHTHAHKHTHARTHM